MCDEAAILEPLRDDAFDGQPRREHWGIVADFFDDRDDWRGPAIREMLRRGLEPYCGRSTGRYYWKPEGQSIFKDSRSDLLSDVFVRLQGQRMTRDASDVELVIHANRYLAELDLLQALKPF